MINIEADLKSALSSVFRSRRRRVLIFASVLIFALVCLSDLWARLSQYLKWRRSSCFFSSSTWYECHDEEYLLEVGLGEHAQRRAEHTFGPNGLLLVNSEAAMHPIDALIRDAHGSWQQKLSRASTSLSIAIVEYERRYSRAPPARFDEWWTWAVEERGVQLPDEYDQIARDLAPFYGISPSDLRKLVSFRGNYTLSKTQTLTIGKLHDNDPISVLAYNGPMETEAEKNMGARFRRSVEGNYVSVLQPVAHLLPAFTILVAPHDSPPYVMEWEMRDKLTLAGQRGEYLDVEDAFTRPKSFIPWAETCPHESPARILSSHSATISSPTPTNANKTFIHAHTPNLTLSPCTHPSLFSLSGAFLPSRTPIAAPGRIPVPMLTMSAAWGSEGVRVGSLYAWFDDSNSDPSTENSEDEGSEMKWEEKEDLVVWRGSNTGSSFQEWTRWRETQRVRLVAMTNGVDLDDPDEKHELESEPEERPSEYSTKKLITILDPGWDAKIFDNSDERGELSTNHTLTLPQSLLNAALSIAFTNPPGPIQCSPPMCALLKDRFAFVAHMSAVNEKGKEGKGTEGGYKYLIDVDGNGWSGRFKRLFTTGAVILKTTAYPEWFTDRIQPWVHYVPLKMDYDDLYDVVGYFRGIDLQVSSGSEDSEADDGGIKEQKRHGAHDDAAHRIAQQGRAWSREFWRKDDLTAYLYRLILEYIRLTSDDRDGASYTT